MSDLRLILLSVVVATCTEAGAVKDVHMPLCSGAFVVTEMTN
jgi:hypothetical protein